MIYLDDRQEKYKVDEDFIKQVKNAIDFSLKKEGVSVPYEVSLLFVDNEEIRKINSDNRGIDKETDVLSFPMLDFPKDKVYKDVYLNHSFDATFLDGEELVLGDIVLSLEKAMEQSKEFNHSFLREACYLVVHSVLHLLGYDHMDEEEKKVMREREEEVLDELNIKRD
ncbi:probable rRNA maturation factor [Clostridium cavendishii DSM 21758]|uniref:Endoribonuclease YbeY n=1 Tax=Clostridium cavendishii DSM 21758 TaxID=1121302 RepID=A0A1M6AMS6_9CLOT|nr:rRNA maturation RNase YbeY [Clostridium cavendishii]SHI37513.1 probable rRNA maturation factor [Clostridium cavendishii DSM 21758]